MYLRADIALASGLPEALARAMAAALACGSACCTGSIVAAQAATALVNICIPEWPLHIAASALSNSHRRVGASLRQANISCSLLLNMAARGEWTASLAVLMLCALVRCRARASHVRVAPVRRPRVEAAVMLDGFHPCMSLLTCHEFVHRLEGGEQALPRAAAQALDMLSAGLPLDDKQLRAAAAALK
jgi:hypothetical protein